MVSRGKAKQRAVGARCNMESGRSPIFAITLDGSGTSAEPSPAAVTDPVRLAAPLLLPLLLSRPHLLIALPIAKSTSSPPSPSPSSMVTPSSSSSSTPAAPTCARRGADVARVARRVEEARRRGADAARTTRAGAETAAECVCSSCWPPAAERFMWPPMMETLLSDCAAPSAPACEVTAEKGRTAAARAVLEREWEGEE
jgi:hypothetical protein